MKTALIGCRSLFGLAVAGAALLSAGGASAQTTASPFYAFVVSNLTESNGSLAYPVYDSVTFASTQINEVFADGYTSSLAIGDAQNSVQAMDTQAGALMTSASSAGYSDPMHGALTSATLTGTLAFPGFGPSDTLNLSVLTDAAGDQTQQTVFAPFSASLYGAAPSGVAVGTFSLMNLGSSQGTTVDIDATLVPAAVPEASTNVSLGLLLALGLGGAVIARRKRTAAIN